MKSKLRMLAVGAAVGAMVGAGVVASGGKYNLCP